MIIEFRDPAGEVQDWIISYIRSKLMQLHKKHREISRAQIDLKKESDTSDNEKVCQMGVSLSDDSIFIRGKANSYEHAAKNAIDELSQKIEERARQHKKQPDTLPGTAADCEPSANDYC